MEGSRRSGPSQRRAWNLRTRLPLLILAGSPIFALLAMPAPAAAFSLADLWHFGKSEPEEPVPDPTPYALTFEVTGAPRGLERNLERASTLADLEDTPPSGLVGLLARARRDLSGLTGVLYENARYAGRIRITVDGRPLEDVRPFDAIRTEPVPVHVVVEAGPAFTFGRVEAAPLPPGFDLSDLRLHPGEEAGSAEILAAEARLADGWREAGHPLVRVLEREVVADHAAARLDVRLAVDPGPRAHFGRVTVEGAEAVDPVLVHRRAGIEGGVYTPRVTRRAEQRLRDLGVFESVSVRPADRLDPDGTIPVTIMVGERKPRVVGASVAYSSTEGGGAEIYWMHRNLFGGAEQLRLSGGVSRLFDGALDDPDFRLAARFQKPAVLGPMTDFTANTEFYRETTDSYRVTGAKAEAGLTRAFSDHLTGGIAFSIERSRTVEQMLTRDHLIATATGTLTWDSRDNRLDPTDGYRARLLAAPAYDFSQDHAFATFRAEGSAYRALDHEARFILAGRVAAAVLTTDDVLKVAADRRLYAGGGGSVRGYGFKNIGPRDMMGEVIGGRSLFEASLELRTRINDQFGFVAFVDAGNAYASMMPDIGDIKVSAGVGLRYFSPVGPLRLDVAVPLNPEKGDPDFGIYVGLGQAF